MLMQAQADAKRYRDREHTEAKQKIATTTKNNQSILILPTERSSIARALILPFNSSIIIH